MAASVTQSFTQAILNQLAQLGIRMEGKLLANIQQHEGEERLPLMLQDKLWLEVERHGSKGIGMHIGLAMQPQNFDTLGFLLLSSPSLSVAVDSLISYSPLIGEGGQFAKSRDKLGWGVRYEPKFTAAVDVRIEAIMAGIATGARWVAGKNITPVAVCFKHDQQAPTALYNEVFGEAEVSFNQSQNAIIYSDNDWHFKQREVNPAIQAQMLELASQQLNQLTAHSFLEKVEALLLNQPWLTRSQIAASLAVSERTLLRRLQETETNYLTMAQGIRKQHALSQIQRPDVTQESLARYLGYNDASAFAKAFKRWTGLGFRAYREQVNKAEL
ncbi:AraC family transcriptional regulator [Alteromonas lipotrueae]|uniref:AraC family transcriptional regulator n=1 Tax=Alteromonas lipotrueae TaxID=2803814 RepID=UPI001C45D840|nr:AraC family transcriptional regulator [Alteromonas lipotrueae]